MLATYSKAPSANRLGPVTLNRNHPLSNGLGFYAWFGHGGPGIDLVSGLGPSTVTGNVGVGGNKGIFNPSSTNLSWQEWSNSHITSMFASKTELSWMVRFTKLNSTQNTNSVFFSLCTATGTAYNLIQGDATAYGFYINGGASRIAYTGLTSFVSGTVYTLFVSAGATNSRGMAFAGNAIVSDVSTTALGTSSATLSRIRLCGERGTSAGGAPSGIAGFSPIGELHLAATWNRRLAIEEMVYLAQNPYSMVSYSNIKSMQFDSLRQFRGWGIPIN
jgi:hypothetical protein